MSVESCLWFSAVVVLGFYAIRVWYTARMYELRTKRFEALTSSGVPPGNASREALTPPTV